MRQFHPASFNERGVSVPLAGKVVGNAKIRRGCDGLELVIPSLSGASGFYVIPVQHIGDLVPLCLHDQALLALIMRDRVLSPFSVRVAVLKVARSGLAGPEMQAAAEEEIRQGNARQHSFRNAVVAALPHADGRLLDPVDEIVSTFAPVSAMNGMPAGPLRHTFQRLQTLADGVAGLDDVEPTAVTIGGVTQQFIGIAARILQDCDAAMSSLPVLARDWAGCGDGFRQKILRLAWLLDGWDVVCTTWETEAAGSRSAEIAALPKLLWSLPILPRSEVTRSATPSPKPHGKRIPPMPPDVAQARSGLGHPRPEVPH